MGEVPADKNGSMKMLKKFCRNRPVEEAPVVEEVAEAPAEAAPEAPAEVAEEAPGEEKA